MTDTRAVAGRLPPRARRAVTGVLVAVLAAVVLLNSFGRTPIDIRPEIYLAPWRTAATYLSSWQSDPQLGFPSYNVGVLPMASLIGVLQLLGVSPGVSAHLLRGIVSLLAAWGTARLYRTLVDEDDDVGALAAAVVVLANPYTVTAGSTLGISLPLALLPWQLIATVGAVRLGGWRYPAIFAGTFFLMSGANAGVIPIMQGLAVPVTALWVAHADGLGVRRALAALARCAALTLLVSIYWILPALSATAAGTTVIAHSESPTGIASVSSFAEVLRGLGLWPLYGADARGPWQPQLTSYLTNPVVSTASFCIPVMMAVAAGVAPRIRRLALWLIVPAVVVMVGLYPASDPSPFGRVLSQLFEDVPATAAFRTTNKIGAMYVLGLALLLAAGLSVLLRRGSRVARALMCGTVVAALVAATAPVWTGGLYTSFLDVPRYWRTAAAALDNGSSNRVWFVPGQVRGHYRWSDPRPDDISLALLKRPSLVRYVAPVTGVGAANLLAAVDTGLQEGWLAPGTLSSAARMLGVDTLLLRNDSVWEDSGGARPQVLQDAIEADRGLSPVRNYGAPGQNVADADAVLTPAESILPPLQQWAVRDPQPVLRAAPAEQGLLVSGDGYALDQLVAAGLTRGTTALRYLGDLRAKPNGGRQLTRDLSAGARLVLTDTNRRRETSEGVITGGQGPLLPASASLSGTRSLWTARDQTVLVNEGAQVTATGSDPAFAAVPYSAAENAFDGDPETSWQFGGFGRGAGATLTAAFTRRTVPEVVVATNTDGVHVAKVELTMYDGKRATSVRLRADDAGRLRWRPPTGTTATRFRLRVLSTAGDGFNRLSVSNVSLAGVQVRRVAQLPDTLSALLQMLPAHERAGALARTPIDLTFARVLGVAANPADDEERALDRNFTTPVERTYRPTGSMRVTAAVPDATLDRLAGANATVSAAATSRFFGSPEVRASLAVDGDPSTAWVPAEPAIGQSLTITAQPRRVSTVAIQQAETRGTDANVATKVRVLLDGKLAATAATRAGTTRIDVPPQRASRLTVQILRTKRTTGVIRIIDVDFAGARMNFSAARAAHACVAAGEIDGVPLLVHPAGALDVGAVVPTKSCGDVTLGAGAHRLRSGRGPLTVDRLTLADTHVPGTAAHTGGSALPRVVVTDRRTTDYTVRVSGGAGPYWLALGQALDPRWTATMDGHDLGAPQLLNGWEAAWRVPAAGGNHTIAIRYAPQRVADIALGVSGAGVLLCLLLAIDLPRRLRARRGVRWPRTRLRRAGALNALRALHVQRPSRVAQPPTARAANARPQWLAPTAALIAALVFGGWLALAAAGAVTAYAKLWRATARGLAAAAAIAFAVVPVLWWTLRPDGPAVTPVVVSGNPWPSRAALVGLVLLVAAGWASRPEERVE